MTSRDSILNEVAQWLEDFNFLEKLLNEHGKYKFKNLATDLSSTSGGAKRAKLAAERARKVLKLTNKEPIRDIAGLLESSGIKVYPSACPLLIGFLK